MNVCVRLRGFFGGPPGLAGSKTTLGRHQRVRGGGDLLLMSLGMVLGRMHTYTPIHAVEAI